jgi:hypothetical protein
MTDYFGLLHSTPTVVGTAAVAVPSDDVIFDLEPLAPLFEKFLTIHSRHAEDEKWLAEFKAEIRRASGDANVYRFRGRVVITDDRNGRFSTKVLEAQDPDLYARYTRIVAKEQFDEEAFRNDFPDLWERMRAQTFRLK